MYANTPPTTPAHHLPRPNAFHEAQFSVGIFDEVYNVPQLGPGEKPRRSRARFSWPAETSQEDRLLVAFRCMQQAGFETIGEYLAAVLDDGNNKQQAVYQSVTAFLQRKGIDPRTHPVSIVERIFRDPRSQKRAGVDEELRFDLPRYALPPSQRLVPTLPEAPQSNTRNALIDWALHVIVARWQKEADRLLSPLFGFVRERRHDEPAEKFTWLDVTSWSMTKNQEIIAVNAPAIFTCMTSVAVNDRAQKKLDHAAKENTAVPEPDSDDTDDEELDSVPLSTGVPPRMRRDPWLGTTITILVLLFFRYRYALVFPTFIGLFLFTCNAHRDIYSLLSRAGFSVGYSTVLSTLHVLAADSNTQLKAFGAVVEFTQPMFLLLFDNVNKMQRAWQQVLGRRDTLSSGTAATLIGLEDVTEDAMNSAPLLANIKAKKRKNLTVEELVDDIDWEHLEGVGSGTAAAAWTKHVPSLHKHGSAVTNKFRVTFAKRRLRLRKSVIRPMQLTDIDEALTVGVAMELHNLVIDQLSILMHWMQCWLIMICGDQLSIDRIRKIKMYMAKATTPFDRHDWALPVIQLWHLKWNWQKAIFRLHWFEPTGKDIFGLHHDVELLTRDKFNHVKCDFYPAHHILEDRFEALMLDALRLRCEEKTGVIHPQGTALIDGLDLYFNAKGPLKNITFEQLDEYSHTVYRRYMCNAAYEDAQGNYPRDTEIHGPSAPPETVPVASVESDSEPEEIEAPPVYLTTEPTTKKGKGSRSNKAKASETLNFSGGDQSLSTTINFIRMTFWYLEMCAAIAEGDIGRVFEIIKVLRFSFWGAGSTNYGNEMLELACNFLYEFPAALQDAILNNYLVNTTGLIGHWLELDLLQEHYNFWIKRLFNSKSHSFDSNHLSEAVGLNIHGFSAIRNYFPRIFGFKKNEGNHRKANTTNDLNALGVHYRADHIMQYTAGRNSHVVPNEFSAGFDILESGKLAEFLERTTRDGLAVQPDDDPVHVDEERLPTNPITTGTGAVRNLSQFN
ncbi:hypothetical protein DFH09DRAFT_969262, partial [Mycena vulgaris]